MKYLRTKQFVVLCIQNGVYILVEVSFWISTTWWVSLLVDEGVPESTCSQVVRPTSVDRSILRASNFPCSKFTKIVIFKVNYTIPFGFILFWLFGITSHILNFLLRLDKDHWRGFSTRNAHMIHIINFIRFKMVLHLSRSLFLNSD